MTLDQETAFILRAAFMSTAAALLVAKVCREYWADALRRRLNVLEEELFEVARRGKVEFRDPAYAMLQDSIRDIVEFSHRISLTRFLAIVLFGRALARGRLVETHIREWCEALGRVESEAARKEIARFHERVLMEVSLSMVPGSMPLASLLSNVGYLRSAWLGFREFSLRSARIVEAQARHSQRLAMTAR
jgi:hypothetical protein